MRLPAWLPVVAMTAATVGPAAPAAEPLSPGELVRYAESVTWICDDESDSDETADGKFNTITKLKITLTNDTGAFEGSARMTLTGNMRYKWRRLVFTGQSFTNDTGTGFVLESVSQAYVMAGAEDVPWLDEREAIFRIEPDSGRHPYKLVGKWRASNGIVAYSTCSLD